MTTTEILAVKEAVRTRDGYKCRDCGLTNDEHLERHGTKLDVHRLTPGSLYSVDGCVTLCKDCHGPKPRRERGTLDLAYKKQLICCHVPEDVHEALERLAERTRRTKNVELVIALEEHLRAEGFWSPPGQQEK